MMKVLVDYPTDEEEFVIVQRVTGPAVAVTAVAPTFSLDSKALILSHAWPG